MPPSWVPGGIFPRTHLPRMQGKGQNDTTSLTALSPPPPTPTHSYPANYPPTLPSGYPERIFHAPTYPRVAPWAPGRLQGHESTSPSPLCTPPTLPYPPTLPTHPTHTPRGCPRPYPRAPTPPEASLSLKKMHPTSSSLTTHAGLPTQDYPALQCTNGERRGEGERRKKDLCLRGVWGGVPPPPSTGVEGGSAPLVGFQRAKPW